jgi:hypothetical protein
MVWGTIEPAGREEAGILIDILGREAVEARVCGGVSDSVSNAACGEREREDSNDERSRGYSLVSLRITSYPLFRDAAAPARAVCVVDAGVAKEMSRWGRTWKVSSPNS